MRSLFVVGLPCSLSTLVYHAARLMLGLRQPTWTTDGEILNADRSALTPPSFDHVGEKYTREHSDRFPRIQEFLQHCSVRHGFAYKDVVQPFVVAKFVEQRRIPTLFIDRPVADVAYSMLAKGWLYPRSSVATTVTSRENTETELVAGLLDARRALLTSSTETLRYDHAITNEEHLRDSLRLLYPECDVPHVRYIDEQFRSRTKTIMGIRATEQYRRLEEKVALCLVAPENSAT